MRVLPWVAACVALAVVWHATACAAAASTQYLQGVSSYGDDAVTGLVLDGAYTYVAGFTVVGGRMAEPGPQSATSRVVFTPSVGAGEYFYEDMQTTTSSLQCTGHVACSWLRKLNTADGSVVWERFDNAAGDPLVDTRVHSVSVVGGFVYVVGEAMRFPHFDSSATKPMYYSTNPFVAKFDAFSGALVWMSSSVCTFCYGRSLSVASDGSALYVGGFFAPPGTSITNATAVLAPRLEDALPGTLTWAGAPGVSLSESIVDSGGAAPYRSFLVKLNAATGTSVWGTSTRALPLKFDRQLAQATPPVKWWTSIQLNPLTAGDFLLADAANAANAFWAPKVSQTIWYNGVAVDPTGAGTAVYWTFTGSAGSGWAVALPGASFPATVIDDQDGFLVRVDPTTSAVQWAVSVAGPNQEYLSALAVSSDGAYVFVAGTTLSPSLTYGSTSANNPCSSVSATGSQPRFFLARYSASGACMWAVWHGGESNSLLASAVGIAIDGALNVFLVVNTFVPFADTRMAVDAPNGWNPVRTDLTVPAAATTFKFNPSGYVWWSHTLQNVRDPRTRYVSVSAFKLAVAVRSATVAVGGGFGFNDNNMPGPLMDSTLRNSDLNASITFWAAGGVPGNLRSEAFLEVMTDVNPCQTAANPCTPASSCVWTFVTGNALCVPQMNATAALLTDPVQPYVFASRLNATNTTAGQQITFAARRFNDPVPNSAVLRFGPPGNASRFECLSVRVTGEADNQTITCTLPDMIGSELRFRFLVNTLLSPAVTDSEFALAYPAPRLTNATLRLGVSPAVGAPVLQLNDQSRVELALSGTNLFPVPRGAVNPAFPLAVWIGHSSNRFAVPCSAVSIVSSQPNAVPVVYDTLTCTTNLEAAALAVNLAVTMRLGEYTANSTDVFHYPRPVPAVTRVWGCSNTTATATYNCPTAGGIRITVTGTDFRLSRGLDSLFPYSAALTMAVSVGGAACNDLLFEAADVLSCVLPPGVGADRPVVISSLGVSEPVFLVSYSPPVVTSITGTHCDNADPLSLVNCTRAAPTNVTLRGTDFGPTGLTPVVLIGSEPCDVFPQFYTPSFILCEIRAGLSPRLPVTIFQAGGVSSSSVAGATVPTLGYVQCQAGTFQNGTNVQCGVCVAGRFSAQESLEKCAACDQGRYQPYPQQTECYACDRGFYAAGFTTGDDGQPVGALQCTACQNGTFASASARTVCDACAPGQFQPRNNASACHDCPLGTFASGTAATVCGNCTAGTFASAIASPQCSVCSAGSFSGTSSAVACTTCPEGSYQPDDRGTECYACEAGKYADTEGTVRCSVCAVGSYSNVSRAQSCAMCISGQQSNFTADRTPTDGATSCVACAPGFVSVATATRGPQGCLQCAPGSYAEAGVCVDCPLGRAQPQPGQLNCTVCAPGQASGITSRSTACSQCDVGQYQVSASAQVCEDCPPGTAQLLSGQTFCANCSEGEYADAPRSSKCSEVPAGKFLPPGNAAATPQVCAGGSYSGRNGATGCTACEIGKAVASSVLGASTCTSCAAGKFANRTGSTECVSCPQGSFARSTGSTECLLCDVGTWWTDRTGVATCELCAAGKYKAERGSATECTDCPANFYAPGAGQSECLPCAGAQYTEGTGQPACVTCRVGLYYQRSNANCPPSQTAGSIGCCVTCPAGANCDTRLTSSRNYFLAATEQGLVQSVQCLPGYCLDATSPECPKPADNSTDLIVNCCGKNRAPPSQNPFCAYCAEGYKEWNGSCIVCDEANWGLLFLLFLASWVYVLGFHWVSQSVNPDSRIFLNFVQMCLIFIGNQAESIGILSVFSFNTVNSSGPRCIAPFTDVQRLFIPVVVPLIGLGQLALTWCITTSISLCSRRIRTCQPYAERLSHPRFEMDAYLRTIVATVLFSYKEITGVSINFFDCQSVGDQYVIYQYPTISCDSPTYSSLRPFFLFLVIAVVIGAPVIIASVLLYNVLNGHLGRSPTFRLRYGILYEAYRTDRWFYEVIVLIRRVIVLYVAMRLSNTLDEQYTALSLCNIVFLFTHIWLSPYTKWFDNLSEEFSLVVLTITTLILATADAPFPQSVQIGLSVLILFAAATFLLRVILVRADRLADRLRSTMAGRASKHSRTESHSSGDSKPDEASGKGDGTEMAATSSSPKVDAANAAAAADDAAAAAAAASMAAGASDALPAAGAPETAVSDPNAPTVDRSATPSVASAAVAAAFPVDMAVGAAAPEGSVGISIVPMDAGAGVGAGGSPMAAPIDPHALAVPSAAGAAPYSPQSSTTAPLMHGGASDTTPPVVMDVPAVSHAPLEALPLQSIGGPPPPPPQQY